MKKCLLLGNGGREAVLAEYISKGYSLYTVCPYENPSIIEMVNKSGGKYIVADPFNKEIVSDFIKENNIEVCLISSDNLLQDGLIDVARELKPHWVFVPKKDYLMVLSLHMDTRVKTVFFM